MKLTRPVLLALAVAVLGLATGCGKKKEITSLQRKEAAHVVSEAQFAVTMREYARAETLYAKAAELCPDTGSYWSNLGTMRMRLGQRDGAKTAYQKALKAFEDAAEENKTDPGLVFEQISLLALLGRVDDARALQAKLPARFPDNPGVRAFLDSKALDRMLADPKIKEISL